MKLDKKKLYAIHDLILDLIVEYPFIRTVQWFYENGEITNSAQIRQDVTGTGSQFIEVLDVLDNLSREEIVVDAVNYYKNGMLTSGFKLTTNHILHMSLRLMRRYGVKSLVIGNVGTSKPVVLKAIFTDMSYDKTNLNLAIQAILSYMREGVDLPWSEMKTYLASNKSIILSLPKEK